MKIWRLLVAVAIIAAVVVLALLFSRGSLFADASLDRISGMIRSWGVWAPLASVFLMVVQALAAPVPAFLIAGANGVVFGYVGILVSFAGGMCGAIAAFVVARYLSHLIKPHVRTSGEFDRRVQSISERGFVIVLIARLIPFVSFDLVSFAAGLSTIRLWRFLAATAIGMAPATILYTIAGVQARALEMYSRIVLLVSVGILVAGVIVWAIRGSIREQQSGPSEADQH